MSALYDRIYALARQIPLCRVATYGQLARMAGNPRLSRIVGCAMHVCPQDVPAHRVVNRLGELCDAFEPLGRESHRLLLEMEGIGFLPDGRIDLARHQWRDGMTWQTLMDEIARDTHTILGDNLTGIYLHGSIGFGCFRWETSDVDFLIVVREGLSSHERTGLIRCMLARTPDAPPKGIEMSVVLARDCQTPVHPIPFELHFSNGHLARARQDPESFAQSMRGRDPDLAGHFAVTRAAGIVWQGAPIEQVFAPVPREMLLASILSDVSDARDSLDDNPTYHILNLCRTLACVRENKMLSKAQGGQWALQTLPEKYHPIIESALNHYAQGAPLNAEGAASFRDYALGELLG